MHKYVARRLILFFPTLLLASLAIFGIMRVIPGDVALVILSGGDEDLSFSQIDYDNLRASLGLDRPLPVQYGKWLWSMVNGEFGGRSLADREQLASIIGRRLPVTLQLALYTFIMALAVSLPLGVLAALKQNQWQDYVARITTIAGHAMPNFWLALLVLLVMVVVFRWSPPLFYAHVWDNPQDHLLKMLWPALILAWGFSSNVTRVTRSNMLEVLRQDYVRTARSKGLRERIVIARHTLRNAMIPVITVAGLQLEGLLSGTVILESIFGIPGLGQGIVLGATTRDYPVIQSLTMLLVLTALSINLIVDLVYGFVDPRIKYS